MGGSSSKSIIKQESDQLVTNTTNVNAINKAINDFVVNAIIEEAKECSASIFQSQKVILVGLRAQGDISIGVEQKQASVLNFNCIQASQVRNDIANQLVQQMISNLESTNTVDVLNKLDAAAASKAENQFTLNPFASSDAQSQVEQIHNFRSSTNTNKNIENVIKNSIEANFTSRNVETCKSSVVASQSVEVRDAVTSAKITVAIQQEQATNILVKCVQTSDIANQITSDILNYLDVKTTDKSNISVEDDFRATAESSSLNKGIFESLGSFVSSVFGSLFGPFGAISGPSSGSCLICLICIVLIAVIGFIGNLISGKGEKGESKSGYDDVD